MLTSGGTGVHGKFDDLGRFADPSLLILTSLADGPKHGYAIMTDVAAFSGIRMEPGTLYGALSRLERRGWVRPLATAERRRPYQIAAASQEVLTEQVKTMQQIVQVARLRTATAWGASMRPVPAARLSRFLVGCHPRRWRERYGEEMVDVLDQHQASTRTVAQPGGQRA